MFAPSRFVGFYAILFWAATLAAQTNLIVTSRHAPLLNGTGRIEGSAQGLLGESVTLNESEEGIRRKEGVTERAGLAPSADSR